MQHIISTAHHSGSVFLTGLPVGPGEPWGPISPVGPYRGGRAVNDVSIVEGEKVDR